MRPDADNEGSRNIFLPRTPRADGLPEATTGGEKADAAILTFARKLTPKVTIIAILLSFR
jgi:hypothetical protein